MPRAGSGPGGGGGSAPAPRGAARGEARCRCRAGRHRLLTARSVPSAGVAGGGGNGNDFQWCFSQVKGAVDEDVAEGEEAAGRPAERSVLRNGAAWRGGRGGVRCASGNGRTRAGGTAGGAGRSGGAVRLCAHSGIAERSCCSLPPVAVSLPARQPQHRWK